MKRIILLFLASIIFGCSTNLENINKNYALLPEKGVVVFSFTSSGECGYALYVDIRSSDGKEKHSIGMQDLFEERDWKRKTNNCDADDKDFAGTLKAISLSEGTYEIYKLSGIHQYHAFESTDKLSIKFNVKGNNVTYIGNAHFIIDKKTYNFAISDKSKRDIRLFEKKYPNVRKDYIIDILETVIFQSA
jgi:hypothetical protein